MLVRNANNFFLKYEMDITDTCGISFFPHNICISAVLETDFFYPRIYHFHFIKSVLVENVEN